MAKLIEDLSRIAADLLFPAQCALCDAGGLPLCAACVDALPCAGGERCDRCWTPVSGETLCSHCQAVPPAFSSIRAAFVMDAGARRLVHELKYEGLTSLAAPMAALMAPLLPPQQSQILIPVPLHGSRERARGYNQSAELARHLSRIAGVACDPRALRRTRNTEPLAKTMHRDERRAIVAGAFAARRERVGGRRVVLVDDVVTTGATLDACARVLLDAGAADVCGITWARAG